MGTVKKFCKVLGVIPISDKSSSLLINLVHSTAMLISLVTYCISEFVFAYYYASTFIEYAGLSFLCSVTTLHVVSYIDLLRSRSKLLDLMEFSNEIVEKSEFFSTDKYDNHIKWSEYFYRMRKSTHSCNLYGT